MRHLFRERSLGLFAAASRAFSLVLAGILISAGPSIAEAGARMVQPTIEATNTVPSGGTMPAAIVNQSGLSPAYDNRITDFDSYVATATHTAYHPQTFEPQFYEFSPAVGGIIDFNLGSLTTIDKFALWPMYSSTGQLWTLTLEADDNPAFSSASLLGMFELSFNIADPAPAQIFSFPSTEAQYVRLTVVENFGDTLSVLGEIAFSGDPLTGDPFTVEASDELFEESVRVTWTRADTISSFFRVYREEPDTSVNLLSVASSKDSLYFDSTGLPGVQYTYWVSMHDANTESVLGVGSDVGSRIIRKPASVEASDGEFADFTRVTWLDRSAIEAGFHVYRKEATEPDDSLRVIAIVDPDHQLFDDAEADSGVVNIYCITAFDADGNESESECDPGERGFILPPANVQASDGIFVDRVTVTWSDVTEAEIGYNVYRDSVLIASLPPDSEFYEDTEQLDAIHFYSVTSVREIIINDLPVPVESAMVWDDGVGGVNTLASPGNVQASDDLFDDHVLITWEDTANTEDRFVITRDDSLLTLVDANDTSYMDLDAEPGVLYGYCVRAESDSGGVSLEVCDDGRGAVVLAPTNVAVSEGDYETHVDVTWESTSTSVVMFKVLRNGDRFMIQPTIEATNTEPSAEAVRIVNQSGLSPAYDDRITDFDSYVATATHTAYHPTTFEQQGYWFTPALGGIIDFNLGSPTNIDKFALWPQHNNGGALRTFTLEADDDPSFSSASLLGTFEVSFENVDPAPAQIFSFPSTEAQYVRLTVVANFGYPGHTVFGEIAFSGSVGTVIKTVPGDRRICPDFDIASGVDYLYEVVAVTAHEEDSPPGSATGFRTLNAPSMVEASDSVFEDRVMVTWADESAVETGFRIYRKEAGAPVDSVEIGTTLQNRTAFIDELGAPGMDYQYSVTAFDLRGESTADSDEGRRDLLAPSSVQASQGDYEDQIVINWVDESFAETGYSVHRDGALIATLPAHSATHTDTLVTFGDTHTYEISTLDGFGTSQPVSAQGFTTILPPGSLSATDDYSDRVVVTWIDDSMIETGYEVYRDYALLTAVGADITSFTDSNPPSTASTYCVRAIASSLQSVDACDVGSIGIFTDTSLEVEYQLLTADCGPGISCDNFGSSVAIDGDRALVAAGNAGPGGAVVSFKRGDDGAWTREGVLQFDPPLPSRTVGGLDIDIAGEWAVVGVPSGIAGAYFFERQGGEWVQFGDPFGPFQGDGLGSVVSLHGTRVVLGTSVGAGNDGKVKVLEFNANAQSWEVVADLKQLAPDYYFKFGYLVSLDGNYAVASAMIGGLEYQVLVFERVGSGAWTHQATIVREFEPTDVAIFEDRLLIGTIHDDQNGLFSGSADMYKRTDSTWGLETTLYSGDPSAYGYFGTSVELRGSMAFIGSIGDPTETNPSTGGEAVYTFSRDPGGGWTEQYKLVNPNTDPEDAEFGASMAADRTQLIIGATFQDSADPDGSVYIAEFGDTDASVTASDGTNEDRVRLQWEIWSSNGDGYRVYRDGQLIETLGASVSSFNDFAAEPGRVHEYCVASFRDGVGEYPSACDFGWRTADGNITGRVSTRTGAAVDSVTVTLLPALNGALLFDGSDGHVNVVGAVTPATAFSVEFWMKSSDALQAGTPFSYSTESETNAILIRDYRDFEVVIAGQSTGPTGVSANDGQWHHIAVTWRTEKGQSLVAIVKDGVAEYVSFGLAAGLSIEDGGQVVLGQQHAPSGFQIGGAFLGQMDEVRVWDFVRLEPVIQADMNRPLSGQEDGLLAYWPADVGPSAAVVDLTPGNRYGELRGGVFSTDDAAPLEISVVTDIEGNYILDNLRYENSTTFRVTPSLDDRVFEPSFKLVTLSRESPIQNEVAFSDITSFGVTGFVKFKDTSCFVREVPIYVDGQFAGATDSEGTYSVAVQPGLHTIEARLPNHTFEEPTVQLLVDRDTASINFIDTTIRRISGRVGGGCGLPIGTVTLEVTYENGCKSPIQVSLDTPEYEILLTPQKYFVQVVDVQNAPDALDRADILAFFDNLGQQIIDLTEEDASQDFVFRAPLSIRVTGLPPAACNGQTITDPETGVEFAGVPIIAQGGSVPLTIEVFEDYGDGNLCPVDSATVTIFDEIRDIEGEPVTLVIGEDDNGTVQYTTIGNTPNIFTGRRDSQGNDRSFQKPLTVVASVEGRESVQQTDWVIVTGDKPRTGTFLTVATDEFPILILRDPPGDGSSAFWEEGTTLTGTFSAMTVETLSFGHKVKAKAGLRFDSGISFFSTNNAVNQTVTSTHTLTIEASQQGELVVTATTNEKFGTSNNELFTGTEGDVYVGAGLNLLFAKADVLDIDTQNCQVMKSQSIRFGGDDDTFETSFLYTSNHIRNTLIPQLEEAILLDPTGTPIEQSQIETWQKYLAFNDVLVTAAPTIENRSFSAGAELDYQTSSSVGGSFSFDFKIFTKSELGTEFGFEVAGSGGEATLAASFGFEFKAGGGVVTDTTTTTGYTLSDDDIGDYFSVDVGEDPIYGTPVFRTRSGRSSCPWEFGTQPRDSAAVAIEPPVRYDVPPNESAVFTLTLFNASPSEELREYTLLQNLSSNPGGAVLKVNGRTLGSQQYFINPDEGQEVTLTVDRGPNKFIYRDLELLLVPPCEFERFRNGGPLLLADTLSFDVIFQSDCSDVTLFEPGSDWRFNEANAAATADTLLITLEDFAIDLGELGVDDEDLVSVGAEYRLVDREDWLPIVEILADDLPLFPDGRPKSKQFPWYVGQIDDGSYTLRAFTRCALGRTFSAPATGLIDRMAPERFGTPQPADGVLALGDEVSIRFNEEIDCNTVTRDRVTLEYFDSVTDTLVSVFMEIACDGSTILMEPNEAVLLQLEGKELIARVEGIQDLAGNPLVGSETWSFDVRRSEFVWADAAILEETSFESGGVISTKLVNGNAADLDFTLGGPLPEWLVPSLSGGTVVAGGSFPVSFTFPDTLGKSVIDGDPGATATFQTTVLASVTNPPLVAPLDIRIDITCGPPTWSVSAARYEHSMSAAVELNIETQISDDGNDIVGAFVGGQLRGVGRPEFVVSLNRWVTFMTIFSNRPAGEIVRFRVFDASTCHVYPSTGQTARFESNRRWGTVDTPQVLIASDDVPAGTQTVSLDEGWAWFSLNLEQQDMTIFNLLGNLIPAQGDHIKSRTEFSSFDENLDWQGGLTEVNNRETYLIRLSESGTLLHEGDPVSGDIPIPLVQDWNWVGYPPAVPLDVNTALAGISPTNYDTIKSQDEFAQYVATESEWIGSLTTMEPGQGYKLYIADPLQSGPNLRYPQNAPPGPLALRGSSESRAVAGSELGWALPNRGFQYNMSIIARVEVEGVHLGAPAVVAAFVGDEVRGVAELVPLGTGAVAFLMVHSDVADGETLNFQIYDESSDEVLRVESAIEFRADDVLGTVDDPWTARAVPTGPAPNNPVAFYLGASQPNPLRATSASIVRYDLPRESDVEIEIFDVAGRSVQMLIQDRQPAGRHQVEIDSARLHNGVYFYRMRAGSFEQVRKLTVVQ